MICGSIYNWFLDFESDLRDTVDCGTRKWLVDFNAQKIQPVLFDQYGAIDVKINRSVLEEKSYFNMLGLTFSSKLNLSSYMISIAKTPSKKIGALIRSMKFLSPEVAASCLYKSLCMESLCLHKSLCLYAWNTYVISGLVLLVATWNCWISYKNRYAGLLILHLLPLLKPWLIIEMQPA